MKVQFIAHAGLYVEEADSRLLIDPWFFGSTLEDPILKSVLPGHRTIDFQVPPVRSKIEDFDPQAILLSHFHTHHSPDREIREFASRGKALQICGSELAPARIEQLLENLGQARSNVEYRSFPASNVMTLGSLRIEGYRHTSPGHIAWRVVGETGSVIHVADPVINRNAYDRRTDAAWLQFQDLRPDLLFIASGGHSKKILREGIPQIGESRTATPMEAARLAAMIKPKVSSVIGLQNHSIWKNRDEYVWPTWLVEDQFEWALDHLLPEASVVRLRPGLTFEITRATPDGPSQVRMGL
jgi:L-ascorbate metabolism protein UlaG (beta-lactamase superfamily)